MEDILFDMEPEINKNSKEFDLDRDEAIMSEEKPNQREKSF